MGMEDAGMKAGKEGRQNKKEGVGGASKRKEKMTGKEEGKGKNRKIVTVIKLKN